MKVFTRFLLAAAVVVCSAMTAEAGPIRDRIKARLNGSCSPCSGGQFSPTRTIPEYLPEPSVIQPVGYTPPAPVYAPLNYGGGCPGGVCPAPNSFGTSARRGFLLGR